jgi:hypothetical protein
VWACAARLRANEDVASGTTLAAAASSNAAERQLHLPIDDD